MMPLQGEYLGMSVAIPDLDRPNQEFYTHCGQGVLHLQSCVKCTLLRYPTTTACPWCAESEHVWTPVSGKGTLYSYGEVHHAIQPAFQQFTPYLILLVELDEQRDLPNRFDGLRINGNLADASGEMAKPELVATVGIGSRLRVVFKSIGDGMAIPLWTLDTEAKQEAPWRYPDN